MDRPGRAEQVARSPAGRVQSAEWLAAGVMLAAPARVAAPERAPEERAEGLVTLVKVVRPLALGASLESLGGRVVRAVGLLVGAALVQEAVRAARLLVRAALAQQVVRAARLLVRAAPAQQVVRQVLLEAAV